MIHRDDAEGYTVITQPCHSWVSGQLARHWGNEMALIPQPFEEVCLAAEQHDIGFLRWEQAPSLNRETGRPHSFMDMPTESHLKVWTDGVEQMLAYNRYSALLVSLHVTGLCERHQTPGSPREERLVDEFLESQRVLQSSLLADLARDDDCRRHCDTAVLEQNRRLISLWDWMSLLLCLARVGRHSLGTCPVTGGGTTTLEMTIPDDDPLSVRVCPWPFAEPNLALHGESRRLEGSFGDESEMRRALDAALPALLTFHLNSMDKPSSTEKRL